MPELVHPIVACFSESESRVRYQAAEALFNVLKIARGEALAHFPLVFDALARLAADPEPQVKQGAELLDRLVKVNFFSSRICRLPYGKKKGISNSYKTKTISAIKNSW